MNWHDISAVMVFACIGAYGVLMWLAASSPSKRSKRGPNERQIAEVLWKVKRK